MLLKAMVRPRCCVILVMAASALAHDMHEIEHVHANGRRCGTEEHPKHKRGRALEQGDCSASSTNPKRMYSPRSGPVYRINTCVHIITSTDGQTGSMLKVPYRKLELEAPGWSAWHSTEEHQLLGHP